MDCAFTVHFNPEYVDVDIVHSSISFIPILGQAYATYFGLFVLLCLLFLCFILLYYSLLYCILLDSLLDDLGC